MDLLKQLSEAKAQGLSKEEFFRLLDAEIKLREHKQQTSVGSDKGFDAGSADVSKQLAKFLQDVDERLKTQEQRQSARLNEYMREQQQQHQQQFQLFQQQQQQQLQHLQQQQERQHVEHIQQLQQQQQQMLTQVQQFQKQMRTVQTHPSQHVGEASDFSKEHRKEKQNFDTALSQVKENFHEMRNTVLNCLEEEKIYMRDELSKAQLELKADLSKVSENVTQIKDKVELTDLINMRDNINKIMKLYEERKRNSVDEEGFVNLGRKEIMDQVNVAHGNMEQTTRNLNLELKDAIMKQVKEHQTMAGDRLKEGFETLQTNLKKATVNIIAMTEKESQLLKNHIMRKGASKSRKRYICDLCIKDFETLINTTEEVNSLPWYIEQCHSSVKGAALFTKEGDMEIWLFHARTPQAVGLKPRSNIRLKVKASVVKLADGKEPLFIAEEEWDFDENIIIDFDGGWGLEVGCIKCANVADKGLISDDGTIVIRFEIQIL